MREGRQNEHHFVEKNPCFFFFRRFNDHFKVIIHLNKFSTKS